MLEGYICEKMDLAIRTYATQMTFGADSSDEFQVQVPTSDSTRILMPGHSVYSFPVTMSCNTAFHGEFQDISDVVRFGSRSIDRSTTQSRNEEQTSIDGDPLVSNALPQSYPSTWPSHVGKISWNSALAETCDSSCSNCIAHAPMRGIESRASVIHPRNF